MYEEVNSPNKWRCPFSVLLLTLLVGYRRAGITNCISEKLSAECNDSSLTVNSITAHKYFMKHIATKLLK